MPSDNDKMLQALADSNSPGTDNQGITNVYNEQISVNEAITPGSGSHDRAALAMQRFLAGRGGGISQAVGKVLGVLGGTGYKRLQSDHSTKESANALYEGILGLLQRHENKLTGKQIKDYISNVDVPELAGGKVNIALLPVLDKENLDDADTKTAKEIKTLFDYVAQEINDVIDTGGQRSTGANIPVTVSFKDMTAVAVAAILTYIATKGWWPKP